MTLGESLKEVSLGEDRVPKNLTDFLRPLVVMGERCWHRNPALLVEKKAMLPCNFKGTIFGFLSCRTHLLCFFLYLAVGKTWHIVGAHVIYSELMIHLVHTKMCNMCSLDMFV